MGDSKTEKALLEDTSSVSGKLTGLKADIEFQEHQQQELTGEAPCWPTEQGFCVYDLDSQHTFFTPSLLNTLGLQSGSIDDINVLLRDHIHPDDQKLVMKQWKKFLEGKVISSIMSFRMHRPDNSSIWVSAGLLAIIDYTGAWRKIVLSINNIEKYVNEHDVLQDAEQRYRKLFENSLFGIVRGDLVANRILDFNKKAAALLGVSPAQSFWDFFHILLKDYEDNFLSELSGKGLFTLRECKSVLRDGSVRWFQVSAEMVGSNVVEVFFNDITDSKSHISELEKMNYELENFVYHSSHDLKSPLRSILGLINIMKMDKNPAAQQDCIEMIEGSIIRLDKLVNDLLSLSRNNRVNDNLAPMNLMVEVNNTVSQFYHTTDTSNLEIIPIVYQPVPFVADLTRVRIVLNNLISNAFKYRSYKKSRSFVRIEIRVDAEKTVVVVADNGTGIQKSRLPRIFDMFYRASENSEGSGLGLYIVKNVLDKIQGSISVESEEGIGSVFTVEFPNHWNGKW
jgi:PAS domain S-box-containing protein